MSLAPLIPPQDISNLELISSMSNTMNLINQVLLSIASAADPGDPGNVISAIFTKMMRSIRFLSIIYSFRLEWVFLSYKPSTGFVSYAPNPPSGLKNTIQFLPSPGKFNMYQIPSRFLVNFWGPMLFLAMSFAVYLFFHLLELIFENQKKQQTIHMVLKRLRVIFQNFVIAQLYNYYSDILLYAILEFRGFNEYHGLDWISFALAVLFIILGLLLFGGNFFVVKDYQKAKLQAQKYQIPSDFELFQTGYQGLQIFLKGFKDSSILNQLFLFIFVIRTTLVYIFLGSLIDYPMIQASLIAFLTLANGVYLVIKRPFRSVVNFVMEIVYEIVFLIVNGLMVTLATLDVSVDSISLRDTLSEAILYISIGFNFLPVLFLLFKGFIAAKELFKTKDKNPVNSVNRSHRGTRNDDNDVTRARKSGKNTKQAPLDDTLQAINKTMDKTLDISRNEPLESISKKKKFGPSKELKSQGSVGLSLIYDKKEESGKYPEIEEQETKQIDLPEIDFEAKPKKSAMSRNLNKQSSQYT